MQMHQTPSDDWQAVAPRAQSRRVWAQSRQVVARIAGA